MRYFILKSSNTKNIELSQQRGIWSTTPNSEQKLNRAFLESSAVFLVFSVQGSGHFQVPIHADDTTPSVIWGVGTSKVVLCGICVVRQGYARMTSEISGERCLDWGSAGLGGVFGVEWVRKEILPFQHTQQLLNPWNDNKRVQISRDGQVRVRVEKCSGWVSEVAPYSQQYFTNIVHFEEQVSELGHSRCGRHLPSLTIDAHQLYPCYYDASWD